MSRAGGYVCPVSQQGLAREQRLCRLWSRGMRPSSWWRREREEGRSRALGGLGLLLLPYLLCSLPAGRVSLAQFALAFVTDTCVAGALLCGAGLLFHGMLLLRGQTTWEWARGQHAYDLGPCHNLQAALGPRWVLVWLWPFLASPLPGDGITFQTTADVGLMAS